MSKKQKNMPKPSGEKQAPNTNPSNSPKKKIEIKEYNKPLNDKQTIFLLNGFRNKIQNTQTYQRMGATQKAIVLEAVRFYVNSQRIKYSVRENDGEKVLQFYFPFNVPGVDMTVTFIIEIKENKWNEF